MQGAIFERDDNMTITIGRTSDDRRKLHKSFTGADITAQLKQPCDVLNPVFIITYSTDYITCNYVHVSDFGRYYFINNINLLPGNRAELSCSVDVLMSYADSIGGLTVNVNRQENIVEPYLPDTSYIYLDIYDVVNLLPTTRINTNFLQSGTSSDYFFILGVAGGTNTHQNDIPGFTLLTSEPSDWSLRFMFYYVNLSSNDTPQIENIGNLISQGQVSASDASSFSTMQTYYGAVYARS